VVLISQRLERGPVDSRVVRGHISATWRIRLNGPSLAAMRSYVNYFDHLLLLSLAWYASFAADNIMFCAISTI